VLTIDFVYFRKSQVAFKYAQSCSNERSVFWVKADTAESIESGYLAIARLLVPDFQHMANADALLKVKKHLERKSTLPWLLVLDEANDKELFIGESEGLKLIKYIPRSSRGQVLSTTRDRQISRLAAGQIVPPENGLEVGPMSVKDGFALLQKCMRSDDKWQASEEQCRPFLKMLGGLPLAIIQASSYMLETQTTVDEFIVLYKNIELHGRIFKEPAVDIDMKQISVLYTWEISYQRIAETPYPGSKSQSAMLLDILGFIDSQSSPLRALSEAEFIFKDHDGPTPIGGLESSFETQETPSGLLSKVFKKHFKPNTNDVFREAVGRLCNYSLVTPRDCWVHPVVHSWISRRLPLDERCKYIEWLVEELLLHIVLSDDNSEHSWEKFLLPPIYNSLVVPELTPIRHAAVVLEHAQSRAITGNMASRGGFALHLATLLYRTGRITASMGKTKDGIGYLEKAIGTMNDVVDPTLLSEMRLQLAQIRKRINSHAEAIAEARSCADGVPSNQATIWLAQCLQSGGYLREALELFDTIINTLSTHEVMESETGRVIMAAKVGAMQVLSDIGDAQSKARARHIIDNTLAPYLKSLPGGHMLKTMLYPEILICRVEVADGLLDQRIAAQIVMEHSVTYLGHSLTRGRPQEWRLHIETLREKRKWSVIEALAESFIRSRLSVEELLTLCINSQDNPQQLDIFFTEIDAWCTIYNRLGRACFKQQKFENAGRAHWTAFGLWLGLSLFRDGFKPAGFQSNLWNLHEAIVCQGQVKEKGLKKLRKYFRPRFVEDETNQTIRLLNRWHGLGG
jgi:hypothetical protein